MSQGEKRNDLETAVPLIYREGYEKACARDSKTADAYIRHTTIGDPMAERAVEDLASGADDDRTIRAALDRYQDSRIFIPRSLRDLVESASEVPAWFEPDLAKIASLAFFRNPKIVLAALATGAIVEGFSTLISKSFYLRSRLLENGVRRLKQNNLHLFDQFLPDGMVPGGDGWKLTLRTRLVHARSRVLLKNSGQWDVATFGMPISTAQMLFAAACFSGRLMQHVDSLGGGFSSEERTAYVHVWRYSGFLLGIPDAILFRDEASAVRIFEIGKLCEPPPDEYGIIMANSIINSVPCVLGVTSPDIRRSDALKYYQISRELIGNELADQFRFPPPRVVPRLPTIALSHRLQRLLRRLGFDWSSRFAMDAFNTLLQASDLGQLELSYKLPTSVFDGDSREW